MPETIAFRAVYLPENRGLGNALRVALEHCSNELIARMDSDDLSIPDRFRKQLNVFVQAPDTDIVGGSITEFVGDPDHITGVRAVETTDGTIKADMKKRCAMNHVSVMYKKSAVLAAGGYLDWFWNEDYYLWIRMMERGCRFANVPEPLVNVRTGADMSKRRGGWKYFCSERGLQKYMLDHRMIGLPRYLYNVAARFFGEVLAPNWVRTLLFRLIRKEYVPEPGGEAESQPQEARDLPPFSVAMSVYGKDDPQWFDLALDSVVRQTAKPAEIVLVVDGPVPDEVRDVITKYEAICGGK